MSQNTATAHPSRRAPSAVERFWHALTARQPGVSSWPSAIRRGALVGIICLIGAATGTYAELSIVAIGAFNLGLVDAAAPRATLRQALVWVTVLGTLVAGIASFVAGSWWAVVLLMVLAYLLGSYGGRGLVALNVTLMTLVMAVLFTNDPRPLSGALQIAGLVFIGSAIQSIVSLIFWRYERESTLRRAIGLALTEIARTVSSTRDEFAAQVSAVQFCAQAESALAGARLNPVRNRLYQDVLTEISWFRLCVNAWLGAGQPTQEERTFVIAALRRLDEQIRSRPTKTSVPPVPPSLDDPTWAALTEQLHVLENRVGELHDQKFKLSDGEGSPHHDGSRPRPKVRQQSRELGRMLLPGSSTFRHAARLTFAVGVAEAFVVATHLQRGYWVPLTVVMIVKPDFTTTVTRAVLRIVGTIAAIAVVGGIMMAAGSSIWITTALLVLVTAPLTMRWMTANYAFAAFAITATVLCLVEAGDPSSTVYVLRLQNTFIGVFIGILAYLLFPSWSTDRIPELLVHAIKTQRAWTSACLQQLSGSEVSSATLRDLANKARLAALNARPVIEAASLEPHHRDVDPSAALDVLDNCQQAALAGTSLEVAVAGGSTLTAAVLPDLATRVDDDFQFAANTLNQNAASPLPTPDLVRIRNQLSGIEDEWLRTSLTELITDADGVAAASVRVLRADDAAKRAS